MRMNDAAARYCRLRLPIRLERDAHAGFALFAAAAAAVAFAMPMLAR